LFWRLMAAFIVGFALPILTCFALMLAAALSLQMLALGAAPRSEPVSSSGPSTGPAIALIRVEGLIATNGGGPFDVEGVASAKTIVEQLQRANDDVNVKAILLAVDSPGGGVTASDLIYHALKGVDKPIVVLMGDVAASGGYYVSMASDWIVANPNTLTGSIGVISEFPTAEGLLEKVGVDFVVVTSGPRKDIGSPYREMTADERAYWQKIVDETYESFVQIVADGRHMSVEAVRPLADGGVFTGRQALEAGLVDQLGYESDAIAKAAELGKITGEPRLIEYRNEPTLLDLLTAVPSQRTAIPSLAEILTLLGHPTLDARWLGP
jgi:protease-4